MKEFPRKPTNQGSDTKSYLRYSSLAFQLVGTILLMAFLGHYLDGYYKTAKPWFTLGLSLGAVFIVLYKLIKNLMN